MPHGLLGPPVRRGFFIVPRKRQSVRLRLGGRSERLGQIPHPCAKGERRVNPRQAL